MKQTAKHRTKILQAGKTATGIQIPDEVVEKLGAGKRPPVRVTINGQTYRNTVAVMGGKFMVGVSAENRAKTGVARDDEVDVEIELDTEPREVTIPPDLVFRYREAQDPKHHRSSSRYKDREDHLNSNGEPADQLRETKTEKTSKNQPGLIN